MFRFSLLLLALPLIGSLPAQARPVARAPLSLQAAMMGEYIVFRNVSNTIDCESFGGPLRVGRFESSAAFVEFDSSANVQVSYSTGTDLKNAMNNSLPTTFEFAVSGPALFSSATGCKSDRRVSRQQWS